MSVTLHELWKAYAAAHNTEAEGEHQYQFQRCLYFAGADAMMLAIQSDPLPTTRMELLARLLDLCKQIQECAAIVKTDVEWLEDQQGGKD